MDVDLVYPRELRLMREAYSGMMVHSGLRLSTTGERPCKQFAAQEENSGDAKSWYHVGSKGERPTRSTLSN